MWSLRGLRGAVAVVATLCAAGCSWGLMRFQAEGRSDVLSEAVGPYEAVPGITRFAWDDLGGLHTDAMDTHAFPLKVLVAALLLRRSEQGEAVAFREEAVLPILQEFGFIIPDTILNMRDALQPNRYARPPPFPGAVDLALTKAGERLFTDRCGSCHGEYSSIPNVRLQRYPNVVVPVENVGTDPTRWEAAEPALATAIQESAAGNLLAVGPTPGYVPPPLTGLWATAPYLHNGSVPTLWHMMHPELRPDRFQVGGHRLDFEWLGIDGETARDGIYRYPDGYEPWSTPLVFDTALPGQSNRGHEKPFQDLSGAEKRALLEYLKLL